jgi:transcriptional regulator with XRE-family HTH domain
MQSIGERIDYVKNQKGLSYSKLAELIGDITGDAVRKGIQRNNLKAVYINILADKLRINKEWLNTGKGSVFASEKPEKVENSDITTDEVLRLLELLFFYEKELIEKYPMYAKWSQRKELRAYNDGAEAMKNKLEGN